MKHHDMYNTMKNEEKAKSLWFNFCTEKSCDGHNNCESCPKAKIHPQLIEMAEWKEQEIINWLKQHINDYIVNERDIDLMFEDLKQSL